MYKQTVWYELYAGRKIKWDSFEKYFDKNGDDETWYIYYIEEDNEPRFELHAHIDGDVVVSAEPFKAEVYGGHGRPTIDEKSLTAAEKKYAISIFDDCFPDRVGSSLGSIIEKALSSQAEFAGYKILKAGADHVAFTSPEGKKVKLNHKLLTRAIDYSHNDLAVLRDAKVVYEFARCFGIKNYEPLAAILFTINPSSYIEYVELERKYRFAKMEEAVNIGDVTKCEEYVDVLCDPNNNVQVFCESAVAQDNKALLVWLIEHITGAKCNLSSVLGTAIKKDNEELFYYLLNSGFVDAAASDSTKWYTPMYVAAYYKENEKYVMPLLQSGFSLAAKTGYRFYSVCTLDEIAALLPYRVEFDQNTVNRIYAENRQDIIATLEQQPLRFCSPDILFAAYVYCGDFCKFSAMLKAGYKNNSYELFAKAYNRSSEWTDLWLRYGFDINCNDARLLHNACADLAVDWAIYLLENGADPHLKEKYSQTVFEKAAGFHGYLNAKQQIEKERLCKYLLDIGLDPIMESRRAPSILTYLIGKTEAFDFVLADWLANHNKINLPDLPNDCTDIKKLPLAYVLDEFSGSYNPTVLRYFIERGAVTNAAGLTDDRLFISACKLCDLAELKLVVSAGANINETSKYYRENGVYIAVTNKRSFEIIEYLVGIGIDVNCVRDAFRNTKGTVKADSATSVLDIAEKQGNSQLVEFLKLHGALHACDLG